MTSKTTCEHCGKESATVQLGEVETLTYQDVIFKFFYEIISRVLPGAIILALYFYKYVEIAFMKFQGASWFFGLSMILAAWAIGHVLELVYWTICAFSQLIFVNFARITKPLEPPNQNGALITYLKDLGEKHFVRSMILISMLTLLCPPRLFTAVNTAWRYDWHWYYGAVGMLYFWVVYCAVFFIEFRQKRNNLKVQIEKLEKPPVETDEQRLKDLNKVQIASSHYLKVFVFIAVVVPIVVLFLAYRAHHPCLYVN